MFEIRHAVQEDISEIVEMGKHFWEVTPYVTTGMPYSEETITALLEELIENHFLLVVEGSVGVVGFIGFIIQPFLFNSDYSVAQEVFFWVQPSARGEVGRELLAHVEEELQEVVDIVVMGELATSKNMGKYYEHNGYQPVEQLFGKVI